MAGFQGIGAAFSGCLKMCYQPRQLRQVPLGQARACGAEKDAVGVPVKIAAAVVQRKPCFVLAEMVFQIAQDFLLAHGDVRCGNVFGRFADNAGAEIGRKRLAQRVQTAPVPPCGRYGKSDVRVFRLPEKTFEQRHLAEHLFAAEGVGGMEHAVKV